MPLEEYFEEKRNNVLTNGLRIYSSDQKKIKFFPFIFKNYLVKKWLWKRSFFLLNIIVVTTPVAWYFIEIKYRKVNLLNGNKVRN